MQLDGRLSASDIGRNLQRHYNHPYPVGKTLLAAVRTPPPHRSDVTSSI